MDAYAARANVANFEQMWQFRLGELPTGHRDQWDMNLRAMFAELGVDADDPAQANAAFAGAYLITVGLAFAPNAWLPLANLQHSVAILRDLAERADASPDAPSEADLEAWLRDG